MGDMITFNVGQGAIEAVVHGHINGFLKMEDYNNLTQCDSLADMKSQLQVTEYGNFLQQEATLTSRTIADRATAKLVAEFDEIRGWAEQPMGRFLDFVTYDYMLSNVLKIVTSARSGSTSLDMLAKSHPLGVFEGMSALTASATVEDMVNTVLIDTPIGAFFNTTHRRDLDELSIEYVRAILQKNYLEAFFEFVTNEVGGDTALVMSVVLGFEADRLVLTTARNTCTVGDLLPEDRKKMFPDFGSLADMHDELAACDSVEAIGDRLKHAYPEYAELFDDGRGAGLSDKKESFEKKMMLRAVEVYTGAISRQFQYGSIYAWIKLREMEAQNLLWIAECITQNNKDEVQDYIPLM